MNNKFSQSICKIQSNDDVETLLQKSVEIVPSKRQLSWQKLEMCAFVHMGLNTYTDKEWGDGTESPALFNPVDFDADQWISTLAQCGFKGIVVTCKHHDGFCLWQTKHTDYSVKNSPWKDGKGDLVKEVSESCKKYGVKFGVYLSPWDRHEQTYGDSPKYNEYYKRQLTELLTEYGDVYEVWFDGACAEGPNGKQQIYDWAGYYALIRELQPNAVISVSGPDVRWVGNEAGKGREAEWSVIPFGLEIQDKLTGDKFVTAGQDLTLPDLGSRETLQTNGDLKDYLFWYPAQVDTSIRPGWFYHDFEDQKVKSLDKLVEIYYNSVGQNAQLLLNIPPNREGLISEFDVARLRELSAYLNKAYENNLATKDIVCDIKDSKYEAVISLKEKADINQVVIMEDITKGQRVDSFEIYAEVDNNFIKIADEKTIGYKRIVQTQKVCTDKIVIVSDLYRADPQLLSVEVYNVPILNTAPIIKRNNQGIVSITANENAKIYYYFGDDKQVKEYNGEFLFARAGEVYAYAEYTDENLYSDEKPVAKSEFGIIKADWSVVSCNANPSGNFKHDWIINDDQPYLMVDKSSNVEIIIDMAEEQQVNGVLYTPVDNVFDFCTNMYKYEIYVGNEINNLELANCGVLENVRNNPLERNISFEKSCNGRYLKLVAVDGFDAEKMGIGKIAVY